MIVVLSVLFPYLLIITAAYFVVYLDKIKSCVFKVRFNVQKHPTHDEQIKRLTVLTEMNMLTRLEPDFIRVWLKAPHVKINEYEITNHFIIMNEYKNYQSYDDQPAFLVIERIKVKNPVFFSKTWYDNGVIHREPRLGPAKISRVPHDNSFATVENEYIYGKMISTMIKE